MNFPTIAFRMDREAFAKTLWQVWPLKASSSSMHALMAALSSGGKGPKPRLYLLSFFKENLWFWQAKRRLFKNRPTCAQQFTPKTAARICLALDFWCQFMHAPQSGKIDALLTLLVENHSQIQNAPTQERLRAEMSCVSTPPGKEQNYARRITLTDALQSQTLPPKSLPLKKEAIFDESLSWRWPPSAGKQREAESGQAQQVGKQCSSANTARREGKAVLHAHTRAFAHSIYLIYLSVCLSIYASTFTIHL